MSRQRLQAPLRRYRLLRDVQYAARKAGRRLENRFTAQGIEVNGVEYPLEAIVCATGFAAMTGSFDKIRITGRSGLTLSEKWRAGPLVPTSG